MADRRGLFRYLLLPLILTCLVTALGKFWPSDRYFWFALVSYVPPLLLLGAGVLCYWISRRNHLRLDSFLSVLLMSLALFQLGRDNNRLFRSSKTLNQNHEVIRVMHWNVWQNRMGMGRIVAQIAEQQPQVICLNEARTGIDSGIPRYSKILGGEWYELSDQNLIILSRRPVKKLKVLRCEGVRSLHVSIQAEHPFTLLLVDVRSNINFFRRGALEHLWSHKKDWNPPPDLILGDFNTPVDSFSVQSTLGSMYTDAYRIAGNGVAYTWPSWVPIMRIDLILARTPDSVLRHHIGFTTLSDHRWQWVDYQLPRLKGS